MRTNAICIRIRIRLRLRMGAHRIAARRCSLQFSLYRQMQAQCFFFSSLCSRNQFNRLFPFGCCGFSGCIDRLFNAYSQRARDISGGLRLRLSRRLPST